MKKNNFKKFIFLSLGAAVLFLGVFVFAKVSYAQQDNLGLQQVSSTIGLPTTDIRIIVANIIKAALGLLGIIVLVLILYGGFIWMTAGGNEEKIATAKKILFNSVIGLIIILSAYGITSFIISRLLGATGVIPAHCQAAGLGGSDCGGDCPPCGGGNGGGGYTNGAFYIDSLPKEGQLCIRNIHLAVTFSDNVDVATLPNSIVVQDASGTPQAGNWQAVDGHIGVFVPQGSCGDGGNDCFAPSTTYKLSFSSDAAQKIKSQSGTPLNCTYRAGCNPVTFITGDGIDRQPPHIEIQPISNDDLWIGNSVQVPILITDDNGVQKVDLAADGWFVRSQSFAGCQKSVSATLSWPTISLKAGLHTLTASGFDWSMNKDSTSTDVSLVPPKCVANGSHSCGADCLKCAGDSCTKNTDCASGYCQIPAGETAGVCVDRMRINAISPTSGAVKTYVSISGDYFGTSTGQVYFAKIDNPSVDNSADWVQANLANCGGAWKPWQIIVEVPQGAVTGPIKVTTANYDSADTSTFIYVDTTNDNFGPIINDFTVNNILRPGLCSITPVKGSPGVSTLIIGKNLGLSGQVFFGQLNAISSNWADASVNASVPMMGTGPIGVFVSSTAQSNSLRFFVNESANSSSPVISSISPDHGAKGEYITITGKNFGNTPGLVWFKLVSNQIISGNGDFSFPPACKHTWSDTQIIVKFPKDDPNLYLGPYYVQVKPNGKEANLPLPPTFTLRDGVPNPGICSMSPVSAPIPFAVSSDPMTIAGEYFGNNPIVYFWQAGASSTAVDKRVQVPVSNMVSISKTNLQLFPPANVQTGPVVVLSGTQISNPDNFSVLDCTKNNKTCNEPNTHCCVAGGEVGMCKPTGVLCDGETLSSGYIWRFSTKDIPAVPKVLESCNDDGTTAADSLPTPSPSTLWDRQGVNPDDAEKVCRTALVMVEFTAQLDPSTVDSNSVVVNKCSDINGNNCIGATHINANFELKTAERDMRGDHSYLQMKSNDGRWEDNTWYQVVLKSSITSLETGAGGKGLNLSADKPCGDGTAYCFVFKSGDQDCKMRQVIITPYKYWTSALEEPVTHIVAGTAGKAEISPLYYSGNGLSDQRCIMMDVSGFNWNWSSEHEEYSNIYNGATTQNNATVSALQNTVAVGLDNDAVNIQTVASTGTLSYPGQSPLTIDLNNPQVVDYWPNCLQACTDANVGVRFNTTMSNRNLDGAVEKGSVQLLKCNDENCLSTEPVANSLDIYLDDKINPKYTVLNIANSREGSAELLPNTIYQVIVSASTTPGSTNQLWSAAKLGDPSSFSKPYNKQFTWRFRTKQEKCKIDHVVVNPDKYIAVSVIDKTVFNVLPYSSPDACSAIGQKLNPWKVSWNWQSSDTNVATIKTFSTIGKNPYCTNFCVRKGSSVPSGGSVAAICGNGVVEAGEDCDISIPGTTNCGLNCLFINKTNKGSEKTTGATSVTSSICGNGYIGAGEDCDIGIAPDITVTTSAMGCSSNCLHLGTKLTNNWCFTNSVAHGGFDTSTYSAACAGALSQCGDGIKSPDEDPSCEGSSFGVGKHAPWCNDNCLVSITDFNTYGSEAICSSTIDECTSHGQYLGASIAYSNPSYCGNGIKETGEDPFCETGLSNSHPGLTFVDPWVLATGVGISQITTGTPPAQVTNISASTIQNTANGSAVGGSGQFVIPCGYKTDAQCENKMGQGWGLGSDSCCYKRPKLTALYPGSTSSIQENICPNTEINIDFDKVIDSNTLANNLVIARGIGVGTNTDSCVSSTDVTNLLALSTYQYQNGPWYEKIWGSVLKFFHNLFGGIATAQNGIPTKWCSGSDLGMPEVIRTSSTTSRVSVKLLAPLSFDSYYAIILKNGIQDTDGVSIGDKPIEKSPDGSNNWQFIAGSKICEISKVSVAPSDVFLNSVGATSTLHARSFTSSGSSIQSIPGYYAWNYVWGPPNLYVGIQDTTSDQNIITAQNRKGEIDIRAGANIIENQYSSNLGVAATGKSHVIVFLCENPWPPKILNLPGDNTPHMIFPYADQDGNHDGYNLTSDIFDNTAIPESPFGKYFNFSVYYCADNGNYGTSDDLPLLRPAVQVSSTIVSDATTLKRFIFTNNKNSDAIGIQIFPNTYHLKVDEWYKKSKEEGGQGFVGNMQSTKIDGYDAITDGNNIYVDALNLASATIIAGSPPVPQTVHNLYTNIYLFSINSDARPETRKIFDQLMSNLKFNTNLTNDGHCGPNEANPGNTTTCKTDMDCSGGEVCSVQTDKLKRDYQRLRDLNEIQGTIGQ